MARLSKEANNLKVTFFILCPHEHRHLTFFFFSLHFRLSSPPYSILLLFPCIKDSSWLGMSLFHLYTIPRFSKSHFDFFFFSGTSIMCYGGNVQFTAIVCTVYLSALAYGGHFSGLLKTRSTSSQWAHSHRSCCRPQLTPSKSRYHVNPLLLFSQWHSSPNKRQSVLTSSFLLVPVEVHCKTADTHNQIKWIIEPNTKLFN